MDILLGKVVTLVLAAVALLLAIGTFVLLSGGAPITLRPNVVFVSILASAAVLLLLGAVVAGRLTRVWVERRRGSAGSRLHVRLVLMFGVVAVTPSIVVAVFAAAFFNLGIQSWFDDRIRSALDASVLTARSSLEEHRNNIKADALGVAITLNRAGAFLASRPQLFQQVLDQETTFHGLIQARDLRPLHARDHRLLRRAERQFRRTAHRRGDRAGPARRGGGDRRRHRQPRPRRGEARLHARS